MTSAGPKENWTPPQGRLLLVDDRDENLLALRAILEELDLDLACARSGEEALRCVLKLKDFVAILLDVQMPGMDGFETAELLRQHESTRHTPLLFVTAHQQDDARVRRGYALGGVDFVFKPIVPEILRAKVAVFVDLFRRTEEVKAHVAERHRLELERERERAQEEDRQRRLGELEQTIERYRAMASGGGKARVAARLASAGLVRDRAPEEFGAMRDAYVQLLDDYLEQLVVTKGKPLASMHRVIAMLGDQWGGPRDLVDIHVEALDAAARGATRERVHAYTVEGRLLALEMMGLLVDYYRLGHRHTVVLSKGPAPPSPGPDP